MAAKTLNKIIRQSTTDSMNIMTEQMSKMVAAMKTTLWGGKYRSLALVLYEEHYRTVTRDAGKKINQLTKIAPVNEAITEFSTPFETPTLQGKKINE